jgi:hypothetical protein
MMQRGTTKFQQQINKKLKIKDFIVKLKNYNLENKKKFFINFVKFFKL